MQIQPLPTPPQHVTDVSSCVTSACDAGFTMARR
eukprot:CAMPEP_0177424702 /NCGR_PEP_ID=MMETSP0368-20130122/72606_1 /TAXON_ID=447022 ORGANISM="Scrippsiella hangoei-like, Strain SHHI-4" /NCGR_SAMPLE_ID=MMETSP0368 /ASSEMBLY_ACC=CAM_ASM_000363 /LENGTH=33 /DNA_ID= /DNA_START= /DNA_END= /DNA_ORIENTATION=